MSERIPNASPTRVYDVADISNYSNYKKYCGFLVSQPKRYLLTHFLILAPLILYYIVTAHKTPIPLLVITAVLNLLIQGVLLVLGLKDPGIIPKVLQHYQKEEFKQIPLDPEYESGQMRDAQRIYLFPLKSHSLKVKFCSQCYIYRPPRTIHCWECNMCVERLDHHCPWIGTCVGKRNYKQFFSFLVLLEVQCLIMLAQVAIILNDEIIRNDQAYLIPNIVEGVYLLAGFTFVTVMLVFHCFIASQNLTTNEYCKNMWKTISGNPFKKNDCFKNLAKIVSSQNNELADPEVQIKKREVIRQEMKNNAAAQDSEGRFKSMQLEPNPDRSLKRRRSSLILRRHELSTNRRRSQRNIVDVEGKQSSINFPQNHS